MGRHGWQNQDGHRGGNGLAARLRVRRVAYRTAWLYVCAWVAALSLGRLPRSLGVACVAVAVVAMLLIVAVLIAPRPMRSPGAPRDTPELPPRAGRLGSAG